jgi:hypothetical protein
MRTLLLLALLALAQAFAADSPYNGRWDITVGGGPAPRAWWVELNGVGTPNANGRFVSAYNGDMNKIDSIAAENGELTFTIIQPQYRDRPSRTMVYRARLAGDKLEGTMQTDGQNAPPLKWTGVRAPVIADKDDGSWKKGKPVELFNGKDVTGWKALNAAAEMKWSVVDGVLRNAPPTTDIVSEQRFWNFDAHIEFRIVENSNSGIGLRGRYEIQILEDYGQPPNSHGSAALYSRVAPSVNASRPPGEWQVYDIHLVGRTLTVAFNGITVLDKVHVDGLTAIANNSDEAEPGPFIVQGDHSYVEIRKFTVTPLLH